MGDFFSCSQKSKRNQQLRAKSSGRIVACFLLFAILAVLARFNRLGGCSSDLAWSDFGLDSGALSVWECLDARNAVLACAILVKGKF